jgi:hypothetical protein
LKLRFKLRFKLTGRGCGYAKQNFYAKLIRTLSSFKLDRVLISYALNTAKLLC